MLRGLPADFSAAVVIGQHLGSQGSRPADILARRIALPVAWASEGARLEPGTITICPPRTLLEVLPDRSCALRPSVTSAADRPLDVLMTSNADSVGAASLAAVLSGMGSDGSQGAVAVRAASGIVIAQSEETAAAAVDAAGGSRRRRGVLDRAAARDRQRCPLPTRSASSCTSR